MAERTAVNRKHFSEYVDSLRIEGKCQCWDCLRAAGFTPPQGKRSSHPAKHPHKVFGKDEGGEPIVTEGKGATYVEDEPGDTSVERSHLKHAIANRDVI